MDKGKEILAKLKVIFNAQLSAEEKDFLKNNIAKLSGELAAPIVPGVKLTEATTKDGKKISYDGELKQGTAIMIVDDAGASTPAPDGVYELEIGKVTVANGVVTTIEPAVAAPAPMDMTAVNQLMSAQFSTQKSELEKLVEAKFSAEKTALLTEIKALKEIQLSTLKLQEKFLEIPANVKELEKPDKKYEEMTNAEKVKYNREK